MYGQKELGDSKSDVQVRHIAVFAVAGGCILARLVPCHVVLNARLLHIVLVYFLCRIAGFPIVNQARKPIENKIFQGTL